MEQDHTTSGSDTVKDFMMTRLRSNAEIKPTFRTLTASFMNYKITRNIRYLSNFLNICIPIFHNTLKFLFLGAAYGIIERHYKKGRCSSYGKVLHRKVDLMSRPIFNKF